MTESERGKEMEQEHSTLLCFIYISDTLLHRGRKTWGETEQRDEGNGVNLCVRFV